MDDKKYTLLIEQLSNINKSLNNVEFTKITIAGDSDINRKIINS